MSWNPRIALAAAATALAAAGGAALSIDASGASGSTERPTSAVTVRESDGTRAPEVDPGAVAAFQSQLSGLLPGYELSVDDSYDYTDPGSANYTRLTGTAPGVGAISVSVYRRFDASELRTAGLAESSDSTGTFWVGSVDQDLTSVYFQPVSGPPIWVGVYAPTSGGPAPSLADVKELALQVAGLPVVTFFAEGR